MFKYIFLVFAFVPATSFAIDDFNSLIEANEASQVVLQKVVAEKAGVKRKPQSRQKIVVVEKGSASYMAPSNKNMNKFAKERVAYSASEKKNFQRLNNEIKRRQ